MADMMVLTSVATAVNVILLTVLLGIYIQNYRKIKANFSLGLILFSMIFLIQKFVSIYLFMFVMFEFSHIVGLSMFILELLELVAFSILVKITVR